MKSRKIKKSNLLVFFQYLLLLWVLFAVNADAKGVSKELREKGVYETSTLVYSGDTTKRVDVTIVTSGFAYKQKKTVLKKLALLIKNFFRAPPYISYAKYINVHIVLIDDKSRSNPRIPYSVDERKILTCDKNKAWEYGKYAPDTDLLMVFCNQGGVRSTACGALITLESSGSISRTFLHEMGHAFAGLLDEYEEEEVEPTSLDMSRVARGVNVCTEKNPRKCKWHYWVEKVWPGPNDKLKLPRGAEVRNFEGGFYLSKGTWRPEKSCLMRRGKKFCVVCFEQVEKRFFSLIEPVAGIQPAEPEVAIWKDGKIDFSAEVIDLSCPGGSFGKFNPYWYLDDCFTNATKTRKRESILTIKGEPLEPGLHQVALRMDFTNQRIRRDHGGLSSSSGWNLYVSAHKKPTAIFPKSHRGKKGVKIEIPIKIKFEDMDKLKFELINFPKGARFENNTFSWMPEETGAWRPKIVMSVEKATYAISFLLKVSDSSVPCAPPKIEKIPVLEVKEAETLEYEFKVSDKDKEHLLYEIEKLPSHVEFDINTGKLTWKPSSDQAGKYKLSLKVYDQKFEKKQSFEITVSENKAQNIRNFDIKYSLRSKSYRDRLSAIGKLTEYPETYAIFEYNRLLRDRSDKVWKEALVKLNDEISKASETRLNMIVADLNPHIWHFSDRAPILDVLKKLLEKIPEKSKQAKKLKTKLYSVDKYNKKAGCPEL